MLHTKICISNGLPGNFSQQKLKKMSKADPKEYFSKKKLSKKDINHNRAISSHNNEENPSKYDIRIRILPNYFVGLDKSINFSMYLPKSFMPKQGIIQKITRQKKLLYSSESISTNLLQFYPDLSYNHLIKNENFHANVNNLTKSICQIFFSKIDLVGYHDDIFQVSGIIINHSNKKFILTIRPDDWTTDEDKMNMIFVCQNSINDERNFKYSIAKWKADFLKKRFRRFDIVETPRSDFIMTNLEPMILSNYFSSKQRKMALKRILTNKALNLGYQIADYDCDYLRFCKKSKIEEPLYMDPITGIWRKQWPKLRILKVPDRSLDNGIELKDLRNTKIWEDDKEKFCGLIGFSHANYKEFLRSDGEYYSDWAPIFGEFQVNTSEFLHPFLSVSFGRYLKSNDTVIAFQTSANAGAKGGILFDAEGKLVGICGDLILNHYPNCYVIDPKSHKKNIQYESNMNFDKEQEENFEYLRVSNYILGYQISDSIEKYIKSTDKRMEVIDSEFELLDDKEYDPAEKFSRYMSILLSFEAQEKANEIRRKERKIKREKFNCRRQLKISRKKAETSIDQISMNKDVQDSKGAEILSDKIEGRKKFKLS